MKNTIIYLWNNIYCIPHLYGKLTSIFGILKRHGKRKRHLHCFHHLPNKWKLIRKIEYAPPKQHTPKKTLFFGYKLKLRIKDVRTKNHICCKYKVFDKKRTFRNRFGVRILCTSLSMLSFSHGQHGQQFERHSLLHEQKVSRLGVEKVLNALID